MSTEHDELLARARAAAAVIAPLTGRIEAERKLPTEAVKALVDARVDQRLHRLCRQLALRLDPARQRRDHCGRRPGARQELVVFGRHPATLSASGPSRALAGSVSPHAKAPHLVGPGRG